MGERPQIPAWIEREAGIWECLVSTAEGAYGARVLMWKVSWEWHVWLGSAFADEGGDEDSRENAMAAAELALAEAGLQLALVPCVRQEDLRAAQAQLDAWIELTGGPDGRL